MEIGQYLDSTYLKTAVQANISIFIGYLLNLVGSIWGKFSKTCCNSILISTYVVFT